MAVAHPLPCLVEPNRVSRLLSWIAGAAVVATVVTMIVVALWPASETDKARADGEAYGTAVSSLYAADTPDEVDAALSDLRTAAVDTRDHAGDAVAEQVSDQNDALSRAADGFVGSQTAESDFDRDLYQAELDVAKDDLVTQADDFRTQGPEVQQAFWDGVDTGLNGA